MRRSKYFQTNLRAKIRLRCDCELTFGSFSSKMDISDRHYMVLLLLRLCLKWGIGSTLRLLVDKCCSSWKEIKSHPKTGSGPFSWSENEAFIPRNAFLAAWMQNLESSIISWGGILPFHRETKSFETLSALTTFTFHPFPYRRDMLHLKSPFSHHSGLLFENYYINDQDIRSTLVSTTM